MVEWIVECISSAMFSISINGSLCGFFPGKRGLRQGDPMSLYLFTLTMKVFSGLLDNAVGRGPYKYHWRCGKTKTMHLCFADDLLVFSKGDIQSVTTISRCICSFVSISGLIPNPTKTKFSLVVFIVRSRGKFWICWVLSKALSLCVTLGYLSLHLD